MTGNIPSYLHTQSSLPNSREEREGPRDGDGREWEIERDEGRARQRQTGMETGRWSTDGEMR